MVVGSVSVSKLETGSDVHMQPFLSSEQSQLAARPARHLRPWPSWR